ERSPVREHRGLGPRSGRPWLPQGPRGPRGQRQDGEDHRRRGRGPCEARPLRQGHPPDQQAQGARRPERRRHRRPRADHGDPADVGHQAVASGRGHREGQV
ncbi:MAG: SSU ribosomal protein S17p (S11e), partial [uncultured Blastococcus sp.]